MWKWSRETHTICGKNSERQRQQCLIPKFPFTNTIHFGIENALASAFVRGPKWLFANDKMSQFEDSLDKYILRKRTIVCLGSYTDNAHIG